MERISELVLGASLAAAVVLALAWPAPLRAQGDRTPHINQAQKRQQARIHEGVKNGNLTRGQAAHLERGERRIQAQKRAEKANGPLTPQERTQLRHETHRMNRRINRAENKNKSNPN